MKISINIDELQCLQIDDLQRRTGLTVECIFIELVRKLEEDANSRNYLCEAIRKRHHEHLIKQEEIKKLKNILKYK